MQMQYQARWVSKARVEALKKSQSLGQAVLLDTFNGFIIIEPVGSDLGDGAVLSREEAEYELQPVWYTGPKAKLRDARRRLALEQDAAALAAV